MASTPLPGSPRWAAEKEVEVLRLLVREPAAVVELWLRRQRVVSGAVMRRPAGAGTGRPNPRQAGDAGVAAAAATAPAQAAAAPLPWMADSRFLL